MLFIEFVGKADNISPAQIGDTCMNIGVVDRLTKTSVADVVDEQPTLLVITKVYEPVVVATYDEVFALVMFKPSFFHW